MLNGIIHQSVYLLLVYGRVVVLATRTSTLNRQTHHAIPQQGYLLTRLWVLPVGHLPLRRLHLTLIFLSGTRLLGLLTSRHDGGGCQCTSTHHFQELPARYAATLFTVILLLCMSAFSKCHFVRKSYIIVTLC